MISNPRRCPLTGWLLAVLTLLQVSCGDDGSDNGGGRGDPLVKVYANFPAWSPDGETIVFYRVRTGGLRDNGVWATTAEGDSCWFVTSGDTPAWSPDGRQIVFSRNRAIWVREVSTGQERAMTPSMDAFFPAWEPNGERIAFTVSVQPRSEGLWFVPALGGAPYQLAMEGLVASQPCWSPDGEWIAFVGVDETSTHNLYRVRIASGDVERLTSVSRPYRSPYWPTWSPDGTTLAYGLYEAGIWLLDIATTTSVSIPGTSLLDATKGPTSSWSPDGEHLVYTKQQLWITTRDGASQRELTLIEEVNRVQQSISGLPRRVGGTAPLEP